MIDEAIGAPAATLTTIYYPFGHYDIDGDGAITDSDWYVDGHVDMLSPHNYIGGRDTPDNTTNPSEYTP